MSEIGFRLLGEEEARRILKAGETSSESYGVRVRAVRRLMPKTTEVERMEARAAAEAWRERSPAQYYRLNPHLEPPAGLDLTIPSSPIATSVPSIESPAPRPALSDADSRARLEQLRRLANTRPHRCAGAGCGVLVRGHQLMCFEHWVLLPDWLQERLSLAYDETAALPWPVELVEQAIRYTVEDGDRAPASIVAPMQNDLFAAGAA